MTTHLLAHPRVAAVVYSILRRYRVQAQDREAGISEVRLRALRYVRGRPEPATLDEWIALCATIAERFALDQKDKRATRNKWAGGRGDRPDRYAAPVRSGERRDPVDVRRLLEILREQLAACDAPEHGVEIVEAVAAGLSHDEIAAELGISVAQVRVQLRRIRRGFQARLAARGMAQLAGQSSRGRRAARGPAEAASEENGAASQETDAPSEVPVAAANQAGAPAEGNDKASEIPREAADVLVRDVVHDVLSGRQDGTPANDPVPSPSRSGVSGG